MTRWKTSSRDPRYRVSDDGRVIGPRGRELAAAPSNSSGHLSVCLGRGNKVRVHVLVAEEFVDGWFEGAEVRHLDGDVTHNDWQNLQWATRGRNQQDKKWHAGQANYKLDPEEVKSIKRNLAYGTPRALIAARFDISLSTVDAINANRFHKDVQP